MVAKKLLVDDKIQACAKENVSWVLYVMFWKEKHCLIKQFASLKNISYWHLNFVVRVTYYFFYELLIGPQPTFSECIVIFLWYAPIGQFCLSGPGYNSRTVASNIP